MMSLFRARGWSELILGIGIWNPEYPTLPFASIPESDSGLPSHDFLSEIRQPLCIERLGKVVS
jgi:hypothetical protein